MKHFLRSGRRAALFAACCALLVTPGALATHGPDAETTVGSNDAVFPQNKQNEPIVAINPANPMQVGAGANDEIDLEACNVEEDNTCPFTPGVNVTGFQASVNGGASWLQPTYTGYSTRHCTPPPDPAPDDCEPNPSGPIGTVPWYFEEGLVADGDPVQTWGPRPGTNGTFSWSNGGRLYFQNLTGNFPGTETFRGFEAIGVSRTDEFASAAAGNKAAWMRPVLMSGALSATDFSDKNWIAADDAAVSPFFGNVYGCWVEFRSLGAGPEPVMFTRSTDGGDTWSNPKQLSEASNTFVPHVGGRQGCQVDTDSDGVVYVFFIGSDPRTKQTVQKMARSFDGGVRFERPRPVATVEECGRFDPVQGRLTFDGVAGARTNSFPSVSIANGAPTGANAPDTIHLSWCDGPTNGANEQTMVQWSTNKGQTWQGPVNAARPGDRPDFPAVALSPDGTDAYLVYMAFHTPWQSTTAAPRMFEGVVLHASVAPNGAPGPFAEIHRGVAGDARASSANSLAFEFLGDYDAVSATNDFAVAVWNEAREATDCPAIDAYRQALAEGEDAEAPAPQVVCAPTFGNTDIQATRVNDPS
jgi:hypothetical protein